MCVIDATEGAANGDAVHDQTSVHLALEDGVTKPRQIEVKQDTSILPQKRQARPKRPNYQHIHRFPLPLQTYPLPAFHPTNPLSLLHLAYACLSHLLSPPSSHPSELYSAAFHPESRSCHVTDPVAIRALWEMGFFGKGTLSRSELTWEQREKAKRESGGVGTAAEDATRRRREERRAFKLERARDEAEKVMLQRAREREQAESGAAEDVVNELLGEGEVAKLTLREGDQHSPDYSNELPETLGSTLVLDGLEPDEASPLLLKEHRVANTRAASDDQQHQAQPQDETIEDGPIVNQEHLQLTLEEAFFLSYGLGVLSISFPSSFDAPALQSPPTSSRSRFSNILNTFLAHATFPTQSTGQTINPANPFLLHFAVYHHFRSLGWVVRPGTKFSCDYLLYNRGPVFSHAEFGVIIIPAFEHEYWRTPVGVKLRGDESEKDWWWLHCVNRVQSQVKKTLVLCYVEVPPPSDEERPVADLLRGYRVREFVVRRWLMNRVR